MPEFRIFLGDRLCCTVSLDGDIKRSCDLGWIQIKVENAIAFELFKTLFLTSRFRVVGCPVQNETNWGHCDWDDLKSIFDQFPKPWRYDIVDAPRSDIRVWVDQLDSSLVPGDLLRNKES